MKIQRFEFVKTRITNTRKFRTSNLKKYELLIFKNADSRYAKISNIQIWKRPVIDIKKSKFSKTQKLINRYLFYRDIKKFVENHSSSLPLPALPCFSGLGWESEEGWGRGV